MKQNVKTLSELLVALGAHIDNLKPGKKPTKENVSAARATATLTNSYVGLLRVGLEHARLEGVKPNFGFLTAGKPAKTRA